MDWTGIDFSNLVAQLSSSTTTHGRT